MNDPGNLVPKTVNEDPNLPSLMVNGHLLHFETMGDIKNPIMVFNHGGPGSDFRAMISQKGGKNASRYPNERTAKTQGISQLQDEYFCVFYDQIASGLSHRPSMDEIASMNIDPFISDLDAIVEYCLNKKEEETDIRDPQVYLFGWSFGGVLSTAYINTHPEKVKNVIFYEPGPFTKVVIDYFIDNTPSVFGQVGEDWLEEFLLSHDHMTADDHERADYQQVLGAFRSNPKFHEDINTPLWRYGGLIDNGIVDGFDESSFDQTTHLNSFQGKALFIWGSFTISEYPELPGLQNQYYQNSENIYIPGVGHTGVWEKADEVSAAIRNFLK